jgi:peptide/nickel transport system ATP-binding protein
MSGDVLLEVEDLKVHFKGKRKGFGGPAATVHAVDGVSFKVRRGTTFGIVGESGSGKSTTAAAVMRLTPITEGRIRLGDSELSTAAGDELRGLRKRFQLVFQDPYSSLNPRKRAGDAIREPLDLMNVGSARERDERVDEMLATVGLRPEAKRLFPHQFSGGQRQRLCIARALSTEPDLIVCDEPVSALDVAIQAQILNLLVRLQSERQLTYLFISHDLGVVQHLCDDVAVMYLGQIVEQAPAEKLFSQPRHPYTWSLMAAALSPDPAAAGQKRFIVTGEPPSPINPPAGCRFAGRCPFADARCKSEPPRLRAASDGHFVACHYFESLEPPLEEFRRAG